MDFDNDLSNFGYKFLNKKPLLNNHLDFAQHNPCLSSKLLNYLTYEANIQQIKRKLTVKVEPDSEIDVSLRQRIKCTS